MKASEIIKGREYWVIYNGIVWDAVCLERIDSIRARFSVQKNDTRFVCVVEISDVYQDATLLATRCESEAAKWDAETERFDEIIRDEQETARADLERQHEDASDDFHAESAA